MQREALELSSKLCAACLACRPDCLWRCALQCNTTTRKRVKIYSKQIDRALLDCGASRLCASYACGRASAPACVSSLCAYACVWVCACVPPLARLWCTRGLATRAMANVQNRVHKLVHMCTQDIEPHSGKVSLQRSPGCDALLRRDSGGVGPSDLTHLPAPEPPCTAEVQTQPLNPRMLAPNTLPDLTCSTRHHYLQRYLTSAPLLHALLCVRVCVLTAARGR
jgi:hypothetical protein